MKTALAIAAALLATAAQAHVDVFTFTLSGPAEAPPNASPGTGTATVTLDLDLATLHVQVSFADLSGTTTASHIHCCTVTPGLSTAGVATPTPTFPGFPLGVSAGSYDQTFDLTQSSSYNAAFITSNGGTVSGAFNALVAGMESGRSYLNIHTSTFGGGEIRGFLPAVPVPEPSSWAMLALGLATVGGLARRRAPR